jgi:hypothetical protein
MDYRMRHYDLVVLAHQPRTLRQYRTHALIAAGYQRLMPYRLQDPRPFPVGGHYGVTRSLVVGLRSLDAEFAYQPPLARTTARNAIVLAGPDTLHEAIAWRRNGYCQQLWAGPNIVDHPQQLNGIILSPEIDGVVVASNNMRQVFETAEPSLADRMRIWPAGVDEQYWKPSSVPRRDSLLIYNKRMPDLARRLEGILRDCGYSCATLNYGEKHRDKYRPHEFRAMLDRAIACILLTYNEPQGIAAAEAWSMDVPTFAYRADAVRNVDTLPYLTPDTGHYWSDTNELLTLLAAFSPHQFRPRSWVLANMTDTICASQLIAMMR